MIGKEVETAMKEATANTEIRIKEFTVAPQVNPEKGLPYHEWLIEFDVKPKTKKHLRKTRCGHGSTKCLLSRPYSGECLEAFGCYRGCQPGVSILHEVYRKIRRTEQSPTAVKRQKNSRCTTKSNATMKAKTYFITGGLGSLEPILCTTFTTQILWQESWLLIKKPMQPTLNELLSS